MTVRRSVNEADHLGRAYAHEIATHGPAAGQPAYGTFPRSSLPSLLMRRVLLALRVPPNALAALAGLTPRARWRSRAERFLCRYAYWRGLRDGLENHELWERINYPPLILMYHAIGHAGEPASTYVLPQRRLKQQISWLRRRGYRLISLSALVSHLRENRLPPARAVVLTFDDGYADNHELALPILARYEAPATIFMVSGSVGGAVSWTQDSTVCGRRLLSREQIAALLAARVEIGAHTKTHVSLTDVPEDVAEREVREARADLEQMTEQPVRTFAYPFGDYDHEIARIVERAGYEAAVCSRSGFVSAGTPLYELPRVEIRGQDSLFRFALMIWRGSRSRPRGKARHRARYTAISANQS